MPLIKRPPEPTKKQTIPVRLEEPLLETLKQYAIYVGCDTSWIIAQRLEQLFDEDGEFKKWHDSQPQGTTATRSRRKPQLNTMLPVNGAAQAEAL